MRKIRDLGSLPQDAFDKYQGLSHRQVCVFVPDLFELMRLTFIRDLFVHAQLRLCLPFFV